MSRMIQTKKLMSGDDLEKEIDKCIIRFLKDSGTVAESINTVNRVRLSLVSKLHLDRLDDFKGAKWELSLHLSPEREGVYLVYLEAISSSGELSSIVIATLDGLELCMLSFPATTPISDDYLLNITEDKPISNEKRFTYNVEFSNKIYALYNKIKGY